MKKAFPGRPFSPGKAADQNAIVAAAEVAVRSRLNIDGTERRLWPTSREIVYAINVTPVDKRQYECCDLRYAKILTDLSPEQTRFYASDPYTHGEIQMPHQVGIWLDPMPSNSLILKKYGRVQVAGVCPALVYLNSPNEHYCEYVYNDDRLVGTEAGTIPIIQQPAGQTGEQLCLVNLSARQNCHVVGCPVGEGISARSYMTPVGTGTVQLYLLDPIFGTISPVYGGTMLNEPVYLTVYSLSDDPILPSTAHGFEGGTYTSYGPGPEYYLLHRDMHGNWWIDPAHHDKVAVLTFTPPTLQNPSPPYVSEAYCPTNGAGSATNFDTAILNDAYIGINPSAPQDGICQLRMTGDYTVSLYQRNGLYSSSDAGTILTKVTHDTAGNPTCFSWGTLGLAKLTWTVSYKPVGGSWTNFLQSSVMLATGIGSAFWPAGSRTLIDKTGVSDSAVARFEEGTLIRVHVALSEQYPTGTAYWTPGSPTGAIEDFSGRLIFEKHA